MKIMEGSSYTFFDFCKQTTLHGWDYIGKSKIWSCNFIFWIGIVVVTVGIGMFGIGLNTKEFLDATVEFETLSMTTTMDEVFFPAVYIINKNMIRKSVLMALVNDKSIDNVSPDELYHIIYSSGFGQQKSDSDMKLALGNYYSLESIFVDNF